MKNYLKYTVLITWLILLSLLLMGKLPPLTVWNHAFRRVDLISDIRKSAPEEAPDTFLLPPPVPKPAFADTCRTGMTCIVDYSDSTLRGMKPYYDALNQLSTSNRAVRIAVFGDSFIEADILTADLREMLQRKYGGRGVGYVDITSAVYGMRPTVVHSFGGWKSHAATDSSYFNRSRQGISSRYFEPASGSYVELRGQSKYASLLDTFDIATIYFINKGNLSLTARINRTTETTAAFSASPRLQTMEVKGQMGTVRWRVNQTDSATFYGVALDGLNGISVDNYSLRSSNGTSLRYIPETMLEEFNRIRPYDLIILQYGLNVATQLGKDYDYYQKEMLRTIDYIKACFPQSGILLVSVGDRNYKTDSGELRTMPGIKNLIRYQEHIAAESGIAFWNMFEAMGGEGSIAKLAHATPSKANYDYAHINFRGGREIAKLLYEALVYGKEHDDRRRAYEDK